MRMDVAIVGVGLHPFGRFPGVTGIDMGAIANPARARRRGRRVARHRVHVRGQLRDRQSRRGRRAARAHRHPVHRRLQRVCDRRERADARGQHDSSRRPRTSASRSGWTSTCRARSAPIRALRVPVVVRRGRPVRHDEVLRDEDQQVHARSRDLARDPGEGRGQELSQRRARTPTRSGARRSPRKRSSRRRC